MTKEFKPKYAIGEKVRLLGFETGQTYEVTGFRQIAGVTGRTYTIYTLLGSSGNIYNGVVEARLRGMDEPVKPFPEPSFGRFVDDVRPSRAEEAIKVYVGGKRIEAPPTSDELLDDYLDAMFLFEFFGDDVYREMAEQARKEWERLYGGEE